jgi:hypothetical protein
MRTCLSLLIAMTLTPLVAAAEPVSWHDYVVPESGAIAQIPADVFSEDGGKPESGYGRRFFPADWRAELTVQSTPNDENDTPASFLAKKHPPSNIVYKRVTSRFFVVSSYRENKIWYDRCNFAAHFVNCVLINYPAVEKRQWDGVITRISNTLASR